MPKNIVSEDWFLNRFEINGGKLIFEFETALFTNIGSPKKNIKNNTMLATFAFVYPNLNISGKKIEFIKHTPNIASTITSKVTGYVFNGMFSIGIIYEISVNVIIPNIV